MAATNDRLQQLKRIREEFYRKKTEAKENAKSVKRQMSNQLLQLAKLNIKGSQRAA